LRKIGHMIQIVVHQFVHKINAKKILSLKKIGLLLPPGMREYVESVLTRKKWIPYKPNVSGKHVESILETCKNMTKKVFNLNNIIPHSVHLINPLMKFIYFKFLQCSPYSCH
jgi:hypothetical protein